MTTDDYAPPTSATNPLPVPPHKGQPPVHDKITLMSLKTGSTSKKRTTVRITFSKNIIDGLLEYYDRTWHEAPFWRKHEYRYDYLYFQMAPFHRMLMPGALVRVHPRLLGKDGGKPIKVHRLGPYRFFVQMVGKKLGFKPGVKTKQLDFAWAPYGFSGHGGLVLWFDDDDIKFPTYRQAVKLPKNTDFIIR